ncbi:MAG: hypothetical protein AAB907_04160, partial [Patescibacteria group bacterium]
PVPVPVPVVPVVPVPVVPVPVPPVPVPVPVVPVVPVPVVPDHPQLRAQRFLVEGDLQELVPSRMPPGQQSLVSGIHK